MKDSSDYGDQPTLDGDSLPADSLRTQDASGPPFVPMTDGQGDRDAAGVPQIKGYQVRRKIGDAGQGSVWQAVQLSTGREVAMKFLHAGTFSSDNARARFEREIRLTARLNHRNITAVYDSGLHHGAYYYAMEYVEGVHLDQYVRQNALDQRGILELMRLICLAVQHAHQRGIIHRDLKPSNILVTPDGQPHVLDFGLAKTVTAADRIQVSMEGDAPGTLPFMSPEQAAGKVDELDTRTDIYSLGVILYNLLTGRFPHDLSGTVMAVRRRISEEDVLRPRTACAGIDKELEALLLKALTQRTDDRYESAAELARDIENYLTGEPLLARPQTLVYFLGKRLRKYRLYVGIASAVMLVLMGGAIFAYVKITIERNQAEFQRNRAEAAAEVSRRQLYFNTIQLANSELGHTQIARVIELLATCPPNLRGWEWYRTRRMYDLSLQTFNDGGDKVFSVALSADGSRVLCAGENGNVRVLDVATGQVTLRLEDMKDVVYSACWSDGDKFIAAAGEEGIVKIWDGRSGRIINTFRVRSKNPQDHPRISQITLDPSGTRLAVAGDKGLVQVLDAQTGAMLKTFNGHRGDVNAVAFSPDGRLLVSGGQDMQLIVWDAIGGDLMYTMPGHKGVVDSIAFSPNGDLLASGARDKTVRIWDAHRFKWIFSLIGHDNFVTSVRFTPDSQRLISASWDRSLRVWDVLDGREIARLIGHTSGISTVAVWPDGNRLVSGGQDHTVRFWDIDNGSPDRSFNKHGCPAMAAVFVAGGQRVVSAGDRDGLKFSDSNTGHEIAFPASATASSAASRPADSQIGVMALATLPDGQHFVAGGVDGSVRIWNASPSAQSQLIGKHDSTVLSVAVSPDGSRVASGSVDGAIKIWNIKEKRAQILQHVSGPVKSLAFSHDSEHLAAGGNDGAIRIYSLATGQQTRVLAGHTGAVWCLTFSPDGSQLASGGDDKYIHLWAPWEGRQIRLLSGHDKPVYSIAYYPDGSRLASGGEDRTIRIWEIWSGGEAMTLYEHSPVLSVSFSADGKKILSSSVDSTVRIWDSGKWDAPDSADKPAGVVQSN